MQYFNLDPKNTPNIFFQNGMDNTFQQAVSSANLIANLVGYKPNGVGIIVNKTGGLGKDVIEFLNPTINLNGVLTGEYLQKIAEYNPNNKVLNVGHSAGNKDIIEAANYLKLNGVNFNGTVDYMSVGSPKSIAELQKALNPVGINVIGQFNHPFDPVVHPYIWGGGVVGMGVAGGAAGIAGLMPFLPTATTGIGTFFNVAIGGGIGGGIGAYSLNVNHPFERYSKSDYKGMNEFIQNWAKENPNKH